MLIPYTQLDNDTLDSLLDDYVTRDGTDNGHFTSLKDRKDKLMALLKREEAFITYNPEYAQPCLVPRHEVPPEALREYRELKIAMEEQEAEQSSSEPDTISDSHGSAEDSGSDPETDVPTALPRPETDHTRTGIDDQIAAARSIATLPFDLGRTVMHFGVKVLLDGGRVSLLDLQELLHRHSSGDFGMIKKDSVLMNLKAIPEKEHVLSLYHVAGHDLFVETVAGHSQTMVIQPSER